MEIENSMYTLYSENSLLSNERGDLTDILCTVINEVTNGQAIGAQKIKAVWAICVRDNDARVTLCKTGIAVNGVHIPLYLNNPRIFLLVTEVKTYHSRTKRARILMPLATCE